MTRAMATKVSPTSRFIGSQRPEEGRAAGQLSGSETAGSQSRADSSVSAVRRGRNMRTLSRHRMRAVNAWNVAANVAVLVQREIPALAVGGGIGTILDCDGT